MQGARWRKASVGVVLAAVLIASAAAPVSSTGASDRLTSQTEIAPIRIQEALREFNPRGTVSVAILSTGVDPSVPELQGRLLPGKSFNQSEPDLLDRQGEGTQVATLLAAIAPTAKILPIKVLDKNGSGSFAAATKGIDFAIEQHVNILLIPIGSSEKNKELQDRVASAKAAGLILIASAGNLSSTKLQYPAGFKEVLAVGITDAQDRMVQFSNFGEWVRLYAPAIAIETLGLGGGVVTVTGSSYAATLVAAVAALILATNPTLRADAVETLLIDTATDISTENPALSVKARRVDALRAVRAANSTSR